MQALGRDKLWELQKIISKMELGLCYSIVLPEFGLRWKEVTRAVRNNRLPMEPASVARVLCRYLAKSLSDDEVDHILNKLRLHLVCRETRTWHVLHLHDAQSSDESPGEALAELPDRMHDALANYNTAMTPEVQAVMVEDLVYISIQLKSATKQGSVLYVAAAPGLQVALVSALASDKLLKACVRGLGYSSYSRAGLRGSDVRSLLRIADPAWAAPPAQMSGPAPYEPRPTLTSNGIDFTGREYDAQYVDNILGPDPPVLNTLTVKTSAKFFDKTFLDKTINLTMNIRSDNVAETLKGWVRMGAIAPNCELFNIFHKIKSNQITLQNNDDNDANDAESE